MNTRTLWSKRNVYTVTVQYWCSVSKAKHDRVFSTALLNGQKIQISLQPPDRDLTWRVAIGGLLDFMNYLRNSMKEEQKKIRMFHLAVMEYVLLRFFSCNGLDTKPRMFHHS